MRILAIRLQNLNSLLGEHEVNLADGLRDAPIFLVVGPTGAGKSTLMDAVCLSLFGQTPRLPGDKASKLQGDDDARNVMSRGTAFASAQVEFSKIEGGAVQRYRATWQCHRARKRPNGDFQAPRRSLARLESGEWTELVSSDKPTVYRSQFEDVLEGMTVGDFKRCVLLAQGEFAAFLKATEDERASILERLTDTADYQRIGARAAQRLQEAKRLHQEAEARLQGVTVLSEEQRATLLEELGGLEPVAALMAKQIESRRVVGEWIRLASELEDRRANARKAQDDVAQERAAHAPELAQLAEHERCADGWAALHAWTSLSGGVTAAEAAVADHDASRRSLGEQAEKLRSAEADASSRREAVHRERQQKSPEIERARALRLQRDTARNELGLAATTLREMSRRYRKKEQERDEALRRQSVAEAELHAAGQSAAAMEASRPLIENLEAMRQRRDTLGELGQELGRRRKDSEALREKLKLHRKTAADKAREAEAIRAAHAAAQSGAVTAKATYDATVAGKADARSRREALREAAELATSRRDKVQDGLRVLADAAAAQDKARELTRDSADTSVRLATTSEQEASASERGKQLLASVESKSQELEHWKWLREMAKERGRLLSGEGCPLCGSTEHPLIEGGKHLARDMEVDATCRRLEQQVAALKQEARLTAKRESALGQERATLTANLASLDLQLANAKRGIEDREHELAAVLVSLSLPEDTNRAELETEAASCGAQLADLEAHRRTLEDAEQMLGSALQAARDLSERLTAVTRAIDEAKRDGATVEQSLNALAGEIERVENRRLGLQQALSAQLVALGIAVQEGDDAVAGALLEAERRVRALKAADAAFAKATAGRDVARAAADKAAEASEAARVAQAEASAARQHRQAVVDELEGHVASALGGLDPEVLQGELERRLDAAAKALDAAKEERARNEAELAAVNAKLERAMLDLAGARERRDAARTALDSHLQQLGLDDDEALGARNLESTVRDELDALRKELDERAQKSRVLLGEGQRLLEEHMARRPDGLGEPTPAVESIDAEIAAQQAEHSELCKRMGACRSQLEEDQKQRARFASLGAELDRLRDERLLWERLHALVGVRDGQVFRRFAQSLNLAELIGKANSHLARFAPRYGLTQAQETSGQSRIAFSIRDDWHAGEVRPLTTLSGGETFLVSLSLALALAEYNTVKLPIETLLLDEGFGTLDQETLNVVMHTLEALHAGGRQVGIITHVERLREKIDARVVVEALGNGWSTVKTQLGDS